MKYEMFYVVFDEDNTPWVDSNKDVQWNFPRMGKQADSTLWKNLHPYGLGRHWIPEKQGEYIDVGLVLFRLEGLVGYLGPKIWVAESSDTAMVDYRWGGKQLIFSHSARLLYKTGWNKQKSRLFACDCIEKDITFYSVSSAVKSIITLIRDLQGSINSDVIELVREFSDFMTSYKENLSQYDIAEGAASRCYWIQKHVQDLVADDLFRAQPWSLLSTGSHQYLEKYLMEEV